MFSRHAAGAVQVEIHLHTRLLGALGVDPAVVANTSVSPTTVAYTSYLLATASAGSYTDGVLPCYWIYAEVGRALVVGGSKLRSLGRHQRARQDQGEGRILMADQPAVGRGQRRCTS